MANSETKDLYEIGGAYYYDDTGTKRASADDQAQYLIDQARNTPGAQTMADMGWADQKGGWVDYTDDNDRDYRGSSDLYRSYDNEYTDTGKPILDTTWTGMGNLYNLPDGSKLRYDGSTVGLISALNKYYGEGGWSDGKQPDIYPTLSTKPGSGQVPKSPGLYKDPNDGLTYGYTLDKSGNRVWGSAGNEWAYPEDIEGGDAMTWKQALARAGGQLNPVYDAQRSRQEEAASQNREMLPQLMAARYGMSGTKGGRIGSQMTKSVQAEGSAINAIEGERTRGINELAQALYEQDQARVQREKQLALEQERLAIEWSKLNQSTAIEKQKLALERDFRYMDREEFLMKYGLEKEEAAYKMMSGDREWAWQTDPNNWENSLAIRSGEADIGLTAAQTAAARRSANAPYSTGGTGGSGGSGGGDETLTYKDRLIRATELAKADPRLANVYDEAKGTFTLAQLVDAYLNII